MDNTIIGYQFSPIDGKFVGEYEFPNNLDQEGIHLPPFTTLDATPPAKEGYDIFRVGDEWVYQPTVVLDLNIPPIENYALVTDTFIDFLKSVNKWTAEDQVKRDQAIAEREAMASQPIPDILVNP